MVGKFRRERERRGGKVDEERRKGTRDFIEQESKDRSVRDRELNTEK